MTNMKIILPKAWYTHKRFFFFFWLSQQICAIPGILNTNSTSTKDICSIFLGNSFSKKCDGLGSTQMYGFAAAYGNLAVTCIGV